MVKTFNAGARSRQADRQASRCVSGSRWDDKTEVTELPSSRRQSSFPLAMMISTKAGTNDGISQLDGHHCIILLQLRQCKDLEFNKCT